MQACGEIKGAGIGRFGSKVEGLLEKFAGLLVLAILR